MKVDEMIYTAENIRTGQIIHGTAKELAKDLECSPVTIRKRGLNSSLFQKTWKIEKSRNYTSVDDCNSLTEEDLQKWDKGVKEFLEKIEEKRSKGGKRKPREVR